jgi:hypothetical protein
VSNYSRDPSRSIGAKLTATTDTTIFTVTGYTQVVGIRCANVTASAATVTVSWYSNADLAAYRLVYQQSIPGNLYAYFPLEGFGVSAGDEIRVQAGTANAIDVVLTVIEVPGRSG